MKSKIVGKGMKSKIVGKGKLILMGYPVKITSNIKTKAPELTLGNLLQYVTFRFVKRPVK